MTIKCIILFKVNLSNNKDKIEYLNMFIEGLLS